MQEKDPFARETWPPGPPWDNEPDREEFEHAGLPCIVNRATAGAWCGYVAVPPGHPFHGKDYNHEDVEGLDVHGGLTYANACQGKICHVPKPGEPDDVWWFGFDCNHYRDVAPGMLAFGMEHGLTSGLDGIYRDIHYVKAETKQLAEQLAKVVKP